MRIAIMALLIIAYQAIAMTSFPFLSPVKNSQAWLYVGSQKDVILITLSVLMLVDGLFLSRKLRKQSFRLERRDDTPTVLRSERENLYNITWELKQLRAEFSLLVEENKKLEETEKNLHVALADSRKKLEYAETTARSVATAGVEIQLISLLSLLQSRGRFLDFLMGDISNFSDTQVGRAARVVHQGCKGVIVEYFHIFPVESHREGETVSLEQGFSQARYRIVGHLAGNGPFSGRLIHPGWQTTQVSMPRVTEISRFLSDSGLIIAPAEVEVR